MEKKKREGEEEDQIEEIKETLNASLQAISNRIDGLAKRMVQDSITFYWEDTGDQEVVDFTKIWREVSLGVWGRSVDTISENISTIMLNATKGTFVPTHYHAQGQVIFLLEGHARVYARGEDPIGLKADDVLKLPAEVRHSILFLEPSILVAKFDSRKMEKVSKK